MGRNRFVIALILLIAAQIACAVETPTPTPTLTIPPTSTLTPVPKATDTPAPTATDTPPPTSTLTPVPAATSTPSPTAEPSLDCGPLTLMRGDEDVVFDATSSQPELWIDLEIRRDTTVYTETQDTGLRSLDAPGTGADGVFTPTLPTTPTGEIWIRAYWTGPEWVAYIDETDVYTIVWADVNVVIAEHEPDERGFSYCCTNATSTVQSWIPKAGGSTILWALIMAGIMYALWEIWLFCDRHSQGNE